MRTDDIRVGEQYYVKMRYELRQYRAVVLEIGVPFVMRHSSSARDGYVRRTRHKNGIRIAHLHAREDGSLVEGCEDIVLPAAVLAPYR